MPSALRETAEGCLANTPTARSIEKGLLVIAPVEMKKGQNKKLLEAL